MDIPITIPKVGMNSLEEYHGLAWIANAFPIDAVAKVQNTIEKKTEKNMYLCL